MVESLDSPKTYVKMCQWHHGYREDLYVEEKVFHQNDSCVNLIELFFLIKT